MRNQGQGAAKPGGSSPGEDKTPAMTGGADEKVKTKPSPSAEEASPAPKPNTPTTPG